MSIGLNCSNKLFYFNALRNSKVSQLTSQRVEDEKIIGGIVRVREICDQNGEGVP